jgi:hypothetical protein
MNCKKCNCQLTYQHELDRNICSLCETSTWHPEKYSAFAKLVKCLIKPEAYTLKEQAEIAENALKWIRKERNGKETKFNSENN